LTSSAEYNIRHSRCSEKSGSLINFTVLLTYCLPLKLKNL
jgi:hypothetical protein